MHGTTTTGFDPKRADGRGLETATRVSGGIVILVIAVAAFVMAIQNWATSRDASMIAIGIGVALTAVSAYLVIARSEKKSTAGSA